MKRHVRARTWLPGLLAYPLGGFLVGLVIDRVDSMAAAIIGGLVVGAAVGMAQFLSLKPMGMAPMWIFATVLGAGVGSSIGAVTFGYTTNTSDLVLRGVLTGFVVGLVQSMLTRFSVEELALWSLSNAVAWGVGWWVTSMVIVDIESQYAVFGSTGALAACVIQLASLTIISRNRPDSERSAS